MYTHTHTHTNIYILYRKWNRFFDLFIHNNSTVTIKEIMENGKETKEMKHNILVIWLGCKKS